MLKIPILRIKIIDTLAKLLEFERDSVDQDIVFKKMILYYI